MPATGGGVPLPELGLNFASGAAADTRGGSNSSGFNVDFGDKVAGKGANQAAPSGGGSTLLTGLVRDIAVGAVVAIAARWMWSKLK